MDAELTEALDCLESILRGVDPHEVTITRPLDQKDYEKAERVLDFLVKHNRMTVKEKTAEKAVYVYTERKS